MLENTETIQQGVEFQRVYTVTPVLPTLDLDLTQATITADLKNEAGFVVASFECSAPTANTALVRLTDTNTDKLTYAPPYTYRANVDARWSSGLSIRIAKVKFEISPR